MSSPPAFSNTRIVQHFVVLNQQNLFFVVHFITSLPKTDVMVMVACSHSPPSIGTGMSKHSSELFRPVLVAGGPCH
jgi:hypothetical protein